MGLDEKIGHISKMDKKQCFDLIVHVAELREIISKAEAMKRSEKFQDRMIRLSEGRSMVVGAIYIMIGAILMVLLLLIGL